MFRRPLINGILSDFKSIRFQNYFHGLVFSSVFEYIVSFFQFAEFEWWVIILV